MSYVKYTQADQQFLAEVTAYINRYVSKQVITLGMIGDSLQMSHDAIRHKIKDLTGLSGSEYILKVRLHHSLHQMLHEHCNVSEAAGDNGFKDVSCFRSCFKDEYGITPAEYLKKQHDRDTTNIKKTIRMMKQRLIAMLLSLQGRSCVPAFLRSCVSCVLRINKGDSRFYCVNPPSGIVRRSRVKSCRRSSCRT